MKTETANLSLYWVLLVLILAVLIYGYRPYDAWRLRHIPGPTPTWLLGNVHKALKLGGHRTDLLYPERTTPVFKFWFGARVVVAVEDPELARQVLLHSRIRTNFFADSPMPHDRAGDSLLFIVNVERWKSVRNSWQPMFFTGSLQEYGECMHNAVTLLVEELRLAATSGQPIDIYEALGSMTLAVIGSAAFGIDLHTQAADATIVSEADKQRVERLREAAASMFGPLNTSKWDLLAGGMPFLLPILRTLAPIFPDKPLRRITHARNVLDSLTDEIFAEYRAGQAAGAGKLRDGFHSPAPKVKATEGPKGMLPRGNQWNAAANGANSKGLDVEKLRQGVKPGSFIALLAEGNDRTTGEGFTDEVMAQQALTVLLGGYETTASAMAFACYLLAHPRNAEKQATLAAEIDAFGRQRKPTIADLDQLPYLDAVLKESMRLFPPGHTTGRVAERDMDLGGYKVNKGDWLVIPIYSLHHSPELWPDAEIFLPERWLENHPESAKRPKHNYAYLPFGEGPRICIGIRFATQEAKMTLLRIMQNFTLELAQPTLLEEPLELLCSITLSAKNGVFVRPIPRM